MRGNHAIEIFSLYHTYKLDRSSYAISYIDAACPAVVSLLLRASFLLPRLASRPTPANRVPYFSRYLAARE